MFVFVICSGLQGSDDKNKLAKGGREVMKLTFDLAKGTQHQEPQIREMIGY